MKFNLEDMLKNTLQEKQRVLEKVSGRIENILSGEYLDPEERVFLEETRFDLPLEVGEKSCFEIDVCDVILEWGEAERAGLEEYLFLDTETTGLSSGTGTWVFLTGLGFFDKGQFVVQQYFLCDLGGEDVYLGELEKVIKSFRVFVSYNGKSYDVNLLRTRFLMNGIRPDFLDKANLDLLFLSRRLWKSKLPDCKLQTIENRIMGVTRQEEDELPSHEIPQRYFYFLETGELCYILKVFKHNLQDIKSLPVLLQVLSEQIDCIAGNNDGVVKLLIEQKKWEQAKKYLSFGDSQFCRFELAKIHKREGNFGSALEIWKKEEMNTDCLEELAKYYEHKEKDILKALYYTEKGLSLSLLISQSGINIAKWQKRKARLVSKQERKQEARDR